MDIKLYLYRIIISEPHLYCKKKRPLSPKVRRSKNSGDLTKCQANPLDADLAYMI